MVEGTLGQAFLGDSVHTGTRPRAGGPPCGFGPIRVLAPSRAPVRQDGSDLYQDDRVWRPAVLLELRL